MTSSASRAVIILATCITLSLSGCGGGGDSTTSSSDTSLNVAIKSSNAKDVGTQSYAVVDFLSQQITNSAAEVTDPTNADLSATRCPSGGGATRTVNANTITIKYTNCDDGYRVTDGTAIIQLSNLPNNQSVQDSAWSATLTLTFDNIVFKLNKDFSTLIDIVSSESGSMVVAYTQTAPNEGSFHATTNSLQWRITAGNSTIERNISQLDYAGSIDSTNLVKFSTALVLSGKLGKLGTVSYDIKPQTEFVRQYSSTAGFKFPSQGAMRVIASDKSSLTFTAVDTTTVTISVDKNGDNVIDDNIPTTWTELNSLLLYEF